MGTDKVRTALKRVQQEVRAPDGGNPPWARTTQLPDELRTPERGALLSNRQSVDAVNAATELLTEDLRFEHMTKPEGEVWKFACYAAVRRATDHCETFYREHAREPSSLKCQIRVINLAVTAPLQLNGLRIVPLDDPDVVPSRYVATSGEASVAIVTVEGTSRPRMAARAATSAGHGLRQLRLSVGSRYGLPTSQQRFRLATSYVFADGGHGLLPAFSAEHPFTIDTGRAADFLDNPVWSVPDAAVTDVDRRARRALLWIDRATMHPERSIGLLYNFFALETLLGDRKERLKADAVAFRQLLLSQVVRGSFKHPDRAWYLYDQVRSYAVHGEEPPQVDSGVLDRFAWSVHETFADYVRLTRTENLTRRSQVLAYLDQHPDRPAVIEWVTDHGGTGWDSYLAKLR